MSDSKFWVPHKEEVFLPGFITKEEGKKTVYKLDNGETAELPSDKAKELGPVFDEHHKGVPNVVLMDSISPGAILESLDVRYKRDEIYTAVQTIIIACNPFQQLPLYGAETVDKYAKTTDTGALPPHLYSIGSNAMTDMFDGKNQAVLISGESGAGKTESTKTVLAYLADVAGSEGGIQDKIISTNPVLESFGNSKTERNNNSSRFGKWIEMQFDKKNQIVGATITDYLLEKTRIISQNALERNYHIFYLLMHSPKAKEYEIVADNKAYKCMDMSSFKAEGWDDEEAYGEMADAWRELGFSDQEVNDIYGICAGVLHLSNAAFKNASVRGGEGSECTNQKAMDLGAKFCGLDAKALSVGMTEKKLVVGKDVTMAPIDAAHASIARDVLRKLMYDRMFSWLVQRLNETLKLPGDAAKTGDKKVIGILDIAGFESFVFNTWEQLCINLSNENLQQYFNDFVFKTEMADYEKEGVTIDKIDFADNADILELIQASKNSIMTILDEEVPVSKATDKSYVGKLKKAFDKHKRFFAAKGDDPEFTLEHYAGKVKYNCEGWLEKDADQPPGGTDALFASSSNKIIKKIGDDMVAAAANAKSNKKTYVSQAFRKSLKVLMETIRNSAPHFIRCIKPNNEKKPSIFTRNKVFEQLTYSGALEAVKIRQAGYPLRMAVKDFVGRYRACFPMSLKNDISKESGKKWDDIDSLKILLKKVPKIWSGVKEADFNVGKSKVFAKADGQKRLETQRRLALQGQCVTIQRYYRGYVARKKVKRSKELNKICKEWTAKHQLYTADGKNGVAVFGTVDALEKEIATAQKICDDAGNVVPYPPHARGYKETLAKMVSEAGVFKKKDALLASNDLVEVENANAELKRLKVGGTHVFIGDFAAALAKHAQELSIVAPLVAALKGLDTKTEKLDTSKPEECIRYRDVVKACEDAGLGADASKWPDPEAADMFSKAKALWEGAKGAIDTDKVDQLLEMESKAAKQVLAQELQDAEAAGDVDRINKLKNQYKRRASQAAGGRKSLTAMNMMDEDTAMDKVTEAATDFNLDQLQERIDLAIKAGFDASDLEDAREVLAQLKDDAFVMSQLEATITALKDNETSMENKKMWSRRGPNLLKIAKARDLKADEVEEIEKKLQSLIRRKSMVGFDKNADQRDIDAALEMYGDVSRCSLINQKHVKERKAQDGTVVKPMDPNGSLSWSRHKLHSSMTQMPDAYVQTAIGIHRNILGWMNDRPVPEKKRAPLAYAIVFRAKSEPYLRPEIYVQLIKQINNNPDIRSELLGWKVMSIMSQHVEPAPELMEYLRAFLLKHKNRCKGVPELAEIATICSSCYEYIARYAEQQAEAVAAESGDGEREQKVVKIGLMDDSVRSVKCDSDGTLKSLGDKLAGQVGITTHPEEFSFFQWTEGLDTMRHLPPTLNVWQLMDKWTQVYETTQKRSRLFWKRKYLRGKEDLNPSDITHAHLLTRQARLEHLRYPLPETDEMLGQCASAIMLLEYNAHYKARLVPRADAAAATKEAAAAGAEHHHGQGLHNDDIKALIPQAHCGKHPPEVWKDIIMKQWNDGYQYFTEAGPAEQLERAWKTFQKVRVFGGYYFQCQQNVVIPEEKKAMSIMPSDHLWIDKKTPDGKYWIAVTLDGITFCALDDSRTFQRSFSYSVKAKDRLLRWGAKDPLLQFIVQAFHHDKDRRKEGRIPMSVALDCDHAIDVAYMVHNISTDSFRLLHEEEGEEHNDGEGAEHKKKSKKDHDDLKDAIDGAAKKKKHKKEDGEGGDKKEHKEHKEKKEKKEKK